MAGVGSRFGWAGEGTVGAAGDWGGTDAGGGALGSVSRRSVSWGSVSWRDAGTVSLGVDAVGVGANAGAPAEKDAKSAAPRRPVPAMARQTAARRSVKHPLNFTP